MMLIRSNVDVVLLINGNSTLLCRGFARVMSFSTNPTVCVANVLYLSL